MYSHNHVLNDAELFKDIMTIGRMSGNKRFDVVRGMSKSTGKWEDIEFKYPEKTWSVEDAKKHSGVLKERDIMQSRALISGVEVRDINSEDRTATFVAATQGGVRVMGGKEHLRMSGVDLTRYRSNPVLLDAHNRETSLNVIGGIRDITIEDGNLIMKAEFAEHKTADDIWKMVEKGFIRAVSVGFMHGKSMQVREGEFEMLGDLRVEGPATVVNDWELLELSTVPVPADPDALKREILENVLNPEMAQELIYKLSSYLERNEIMSEINDGEKERVASGDGQGKDNPKNGTGGTDTCYCPDCGNTMEHERGEPCNDIKCSECGAEMTGVAPVAKKEISEIGESDRKRGIYEIAPRGMEDVAALCVAENKTVEESREVFLKQITSLAKPVGTPEPREPEEKKVSVKDIPDDELKRAFCG